MWTVYDLRLYRSDPKGIMHYILYITFFYRIFPSKRMKHDIQITCLLSAFSTINISSTNKYIQIEFSSSSVPSFRRSLDLNVSCYGISTGPMQEEEWRRMKKWKANKMVVLLPQFTFTSRLAGCPIRSGVNGSMGCISCIVCCCFAAELTSDAYTDTHEHIINTGIETR